MFKNKFKLIVGVYLILSFLFLTYITVKYRDDEGPTEYFSEFGFEKNVFLSKESELYRNLKVSSHAVLEQSDDPINAFQAYVDLGMLNMRREEFDQAVINFRLAEQELKKIQGLVLRVDNDWDYIRKYYLSFSVALHHLSKNADGGERCYVEYFSGASQESNLNEKVMEENIQVLMTYLNMRPNDLTARWLMNLNLRRMGWQKDIDPVIKRAMTAEVDNEGIVLRNILPLKGTHIEGLPKMTMFEDLNGDDFLDIFMTTDKGRIFYFENTGSGIFIDKTQDVGLGNISAGFTVNAADYNNDGDVDILMSGIKVKENDPEIVLLENHRGVSFKIKNNIFEEINIHQRILSAVWIDYDNDGWLDFLVSYINTKDSFLNAHSVELYRNMKGEKFENVTDQVGLVLSGDILGVDVGDYNNDGFSDVYVSRFNDKNILYRNNEGIRFDDVTDLYNIDKPIESGITKFIDYNNDGHLDILVSYFSFEEEGNALNYIKSKRIARTILYKNLAKRGFMNISKQVGLNSLAPVTNINMIDIDQDGWIDFYFHGMNDSGFDQAVNMFYKNDNGNSFKDIAGGIKLDILGMLSFASYGDIDNDGDVDMYLSTGKAFGKQRCNQFLINESQNNWIGIKLEGVQTNRSAIGARIHLVIEENGKTRSIYRTVSGGGASGGNNLLQEIGLGKEGIIESLEIRWPVSRTVQSFENIRPNQFIHIVEGEKDFKVINKKRIIF